MLDLFLNPGFLAAGAALVSLPIIIHLINRMRFKRLRWAAMEFLLKSQKRNRRRLIIEQLILLALRCFLVILAALLVLRFVGFSMAGFTGQEALHVVLLDDSPSMTDHWKEGGSVKTCFNIAKDDVIHDSIVKSLGQSSTNEKLAIIPLSKLVTKDNYQPTIFQKLNDAANDKKVRQFLDELKPSYLHVDLVQGVKRARQLFGEYPNSRHVLHIISDFRQTDWTGPGTDSLHKALRELRAGKVKIRPTDVAHPYRLKGQGGVPLSHDNVAITDLRANTRVIGKGMPVTFTVEVSNFGSRDENINVLVFDDATGKELQQIDFNPSMPLRVQPDKTIKATFEMRLFPEIPASKKFFAQRISARLESGQRGPLEGDGLEMDNVRYAAVEIRNKVPVLVLDGKGPDGRKEGGDSFFIEKAIESVPGGSYEVVFGDELTGRDAVTALERSDLSQYPTIFLLNVRKLSKKQQKNLTSYVADGGGVAFFLGENVEADYYNKQLYKGGKGVFPVPLRSHYFPDEAPRETPFTGDYQLLVRYDLYGKGTAGLQLMPIFGAVFPETKQLAYLKDLPIRRYFPVPRAEWQRQREPGRVFELAALPNEQPVTTYQAAVLALINRTRAALFALFKEGDKHADRLPFDQLPIVDEIKRIVAPGSELKAYKLAEALDRLLTDPGKEKKPIEYPNMREFWNSPSPKLRSLREEFKSLRDLVLYGDPFIVAQRYGKGRSVAVMTTAGKDWNDWGGGSGAAFIYQPFIWEMQNWLSSQTADSDLTVGTPIKLEVDAARLKAEGKERVQLVRTFYKAQPNQPALALKEAPTFGTEHDGILTFNYPKTFEPGFYLSQLVSQEDVLMNRPLAAWGHTFNIDARHEGKLKRVSAEDFHEAIGSTEVNIEPPPQGVVEGLVNRQSDLSESPWFFLLFLGVLVAEQALAVHLSFHLRGAEGQLPAQGAQPVAKVA
jgi:hypothetical protein